MGARHFETLQPLEPTGLAEQRLSGETLGSPAARFR